MNGVNCRRILSLTLNETVSMSDTDIVSLLDKDLLGLKTYPEEYAVSIAGSIVKRLMLLKKHNQYSKFYQVVTSSTFRNDKYIYMSLDKTGLSNLKDLFSIYDSEKEYIDFIFLTKEKLFDELVMSNNFKVTDFLSSEVIYSFSKESYRRILSYVFTGGDKGKVVKALLRGKNDKFIFMVSLMDKYVLNYVDADDEFFDSVLTMLNINNYRRLLWDYYNTHVTKNIEDKDEFHLKILVNYTFDLMNSKYFNDKIPPIFSSIEALEKEFGEDKDLMHTMFFGITGYKRVQNNNFNRLVDFKQINDDNELLNLKVAFFSTIYGITYKQAEKILDGMKDFVKVFKASNKQDRLIYETLVAMKTLYKLELTDDNNINLYRNIYFKYVKKNGVHCTVDVSASVLMLSLLRKISEDEIEVL